MTTAPGTMNLPGTEPLLTVRDLVVDYPLGHRRHKRAVEHVSFDIPPGHTLGLVGESGSGKSTIGKAMLGLAPVTSGEIVFAGEPITATRRRGPSATRDMQVVFQDPYSSLDPTKKVGYTIAEPLLALRQSGGRSARASQARDRVAEMLDRVGLPASAAQRYPTQFSGGQRQRIAIARALIVQPRLVICDEVVSALDLSIQAQILNLLAGLQRDLGLSYLFISHDLSVVEYISQHVAVLYRGRVMEYGPVAAVQRAPQHPYTRALVASAPVHDPGEQRTRRELRQQLRVVPHPAAPLGDSCPYQHRCPFAVDLCAERRPENRPDPSGSLVACHRHGELPLDAVARAPGQDRAS